MIPIKMKTMPMRMAIILDLIDSSDSLAVSGICGISSCGVSSSRLSSGCSAGVSSCGASSTGVSSVGVSTVGVSATGVVTVLGVAFVAFGVSAGVGTGVGSGAGATGCGVGVGSGSLISPLHSLPEMSPGSSIVSSA